MVILGSAATMRPVAESWQHALLPLRLENLQISRTVGKRLAVELESAQRFLKAMDAIETKTPLDTSAANGPRLSGP
jgi:hypothetical protein